MLPSKNRLLQLSHPALNLHWYPCSTRKGGCRSDSRPGYKKLIGVTSLKAIIHLGSLGFAPKGFALDMHLKGASLHDLRDVLIKVHGTLLGSHMRRICRWLIVSMLRYAAGKSARFRNFLLVHSLATHRSYSESCAKFRHPSYCYPGT